jgi:hypothetical protein
MWKRHNYYIIIGTNDFDIVSVLFGFIEIDITTTIVPRNSASFLSSLPVSLDCHFLIAPSVFSNVYLENMTVSDLVSDYFCESDVLLV